MSIISIIDDMNTMAEEARKWMTPGEIAEESREMQRILKHGKNEDGNALSSLFKYNDSGILVPKGGGT